MDHKRRRAGAYASRTQPARSDPRRARHVGGGSTAPRRAAGGAGGKVADPRDPYRMLVARNPGSADDPLARRDSDARRRRSSPGRGRRADRFGVPRRGARRPAAPLSRADPDRGGQARARRYRTGVIGRRAWALAAERQPDAWHRPARSLRARLMFTGIITDIGRITGVEHRGDLRLRIGTAYDTASIDMGASIACSGVCLTVVDKGPDWF